MTSCRFVKGGYHRLRSDSGVKGVVMADFDLNFDDDYGPDKGAEEDSRRVEHLPPPPEIGGSPGYSDIHGSGASVVGGRSTSPRLFVQASGHPTVNQLRVWKIENGVPVGLGAIDATASEDDLVREFGSAMPKPGEGKAVFKIRPIDGDGREMGMEASIIIGEHHAALQRQRRVAAGAASANQAPAGSSLPTDVLRLMERAIDQTRSSLDAERHRSRELMDQIADERMNVASNATTSIQSMSEKMLDAEAQRARMSLESAGSYHKQAADNQAAFFQTQMDLMRSEKERENERSERERMGAEERFSRTVAEMEMQRQRQMDEAERRRREEREAWERRMEEMRLENQRRQQEEEGKRRAEAEAAERRWRREQEVRDEQRKREAQEEAVRETARQRDHEMKLRQMELEQGQQREHAERMMQLQQSQLAATMAQAAGKAGGGIKGTIKEVTGVLAMLGMEPRDVLDRFFAPGGGADAPGGAQWAELAGKLMGTVGEVAKAKMIADAHKGRPQIAGPDPRQIARVDPRMMPPPRGMGVPMGARPPVDDDESWDDDEDWDDETPQAPAEPVSRPVSIGRQRLQARRKGPQTVRVTPGRSTEPTAAPAPLRLETQKLARKALRSLSADLQNTPSAGWSGVITLALTSEPAIYHYCQVTTVRGAVMEASGGDAAFTARVIAALRDSPLVPGDLNYGDGGAV